ncbi:MAG: hypothetical protein ABL905_02520, partial [Nitrospiraceae bacterium]
MTMMQRLSQTIQEMSEWFRPIRREFAPVYQGRQIGGRRRKALYVGLVLMASFSSGVPVPAWSADVSSLVPAKVRKVVAAGVGYENAETSSITVKTYDAETGAVLTEETYELNVREDATSAAGQPRERIFAGGVGPGADGLSTFSLRVYDAATGKFLWEGLLNLNVSNHESDFTHRVVAHLAPQALVTQVRSRGAIDGQPQFFLRAVDSTSGQLVWTD